MSDGHASSSYGQPAFVRTSDPTRSTLALGDIRYMSDLPGTDPLTILLAKHLPWHLRPQQRDLSGAWPSLSTSDDPFVDGGEGVLETTLGNSWRKIATLARTRIVFYAEGADVEQTLQWWTVRLYSLARLHLFAMLGEELDNVWEILTATNVDLDTVPFTLRVLRALQPHYCRKDVRSAIELHCQLITYARKQLKQSETKQLWRTRILHLTLSLASLLCEAKDFAQAIDCVYDLATYLSTTSSDDFLDTPARVRLLLHLARVYIQAGSLNGAQELIDAADRQLDEDEALKNEIAIARGTISMLRCDYASASAAFASVKADGEKQEVQARCNLALSTFYSGQLSCAIDGLEELLARETALVVNAEPFLFNLTTLHELRSDDVLADKRRILATLGHHATHSSGVLTASGLKL